MADDIALSVKGVYKEFRLPHERKDSIKEHVLRFGKVSYDRFKALEDINFEVKRGEFFGIVGRNGSGKSTLLKLIGGIYQPTKGTIRVNGTLTPFIELGIGFNPELTGRENVFLNGAILGLTRKEVLAKYQDIVDFAEIPRFMDQKLKNYSSGMQVRLAFSIAMQAHNDILLIDEVLAVGDSAFQEKCFNEFNMIKKSDKTVIFISHDLGSVQRFCDRVMVINDSKSIAIGAPEEMVLRYSNLMAEQEFDKRAVAAHSGVGTGQVEIERCELISGGKAQKRLKEFEPFSVRVHFKVNERPAEPCVFGVSVVDKNGISMLAPNSKEAGLIYDKLPERGYFEAAFATNPLASGTYSIVAACFNENSSVTHDYVKNLLSFKIIGKARHGCTNIEPTWSLKAET